MTPARRWAVGRIATTGGILAAGTILFGSVVAATGYIGSQGESYSPLNHWISELGQLGVSKSASTFNLALVAAGMEFMLFIIGVAMTSPSRLRWPIGLVGGFAGFGGALVGMFPMNYPDLHVIAASMFFYLGWIAVGLASITFVRIPDPRFPRWLAVVGAATTAAFIAFMVSLRVDEFARARMASSGPITDRPEVWISPILEWGALIGILAWSLLASLTWRRTLGARPRPQDPG